MQSRPISWHARNGLWAKPAIILFFPRANGLDARTPINSTGQNSNASLGCCRLYHFHLLAWRKRHGVSLQLLGRVGPWCKYYQWQAIRRKIKDSQMVAIADFSCKISIIQCKQTCQFILTSLALWSRLVPKDQNLKGMLLEAQKIISLAFDPQGLRIFQNSWCWLLGMPDGHNCHNKLIQSPPTWINNALTPSKWEWNIATQMVP